MKLWKAFRVRVNTFSRILALVIVLVVTVLLFTRYSTVVTIRVIEQEIRNSSISNLSVFAREIDDGVDRLSIAAVRTSRDQDVLLFRDWTSSVRGFDQSQTVRRIEDRLILQGVSLGWSNQFAVYSPVRDNRIAGGSVVFPPEVSLIPEIVHAWTYIDTTDGDYTVAGSDAVFVRHIVDPPWTAGRRTLIDEARLVVEVMFPVRELIRLMSEQTIRTRHNPHMYHPGHPSIPGSESDRELVSELRHLLSGFIRDDSGSRVVKVADAQHLVNYVRLDSLDWYLVDAVPLQETLSPILAAWRVFRVSTAAVLLISGLIAWFMYRAVHKPLKSLVGAFSDLRAGNYAARLSTGEHDEFHYLMRDFNYMAAEIESLIQTVFQERIRVRDARMKQLQAQINPHFLYNCLSYVVSMAKLDRTDAVVEMAHNLSDYYRYTMHAEMEEVTLTEELELVRNYLKIEQLRRPSLQFAIDVPPGFSEVYIPRLLVQPVVENAVQHGLDGIERNAGVIRVTGYAEHDRWILRIEDNGAGISSERLSDLLAHIEDTSPGSTSFGLWNTHNRLRYRFGPSAGISIRSNIGEYTAVELAFPVRGSIADA